MIKRLAPLVLLLLAERAQADSRAQAEAAMAEAQAAFDRGDFDEAVRQFSRARVLAPASSGPIYGLGLSLARGNRCPEAVPVLEDYARKKGGAAKADAVAALDECKRRLTPT